MRIHCVGRSLLSEKSSITITDAKNECSCKIGIKLDVRNGTVLGISGIYWLLRHYNYNNKPVYYRSGACSILSICHEKELHLYYGNIDGVSGRKRNGWQIQSEFGWEDNTPPILFHDTNDKTKCPEDVGFNWHTIGRMDLPDVEVTCL